MTLRFFMPEFLVSILVAVPFENDRLVFFLVPFFSFFSNKRCFVAKPWWGIRWENMGLKILVFPRMELLLPGLNHPSAPQYLVYQQGKGISDLESMFWTSMCLKIEEPVLLFALFLFLDYSSDMSSVFICTYVFWRQYMTLCVHLLTVDGQELKPRNTKLSFDT